MADSQLTGHFICALCDEESVVSYCEECQLKLGELCHKLHERQKITKTHTLQDIWKTYIRLLNVHCSVCEDLAAACCEECSDLLCDRCSRVHNKIPATKDHVLVDRLPNNWCNDDNIIAGDSIPTNESDDGSTAGNHTFSCIDLPHMENCVDQGTNHFRITESGPKDADGISSHNDVVQATMNKSIEEKECVNDEETPSTEEQEHCKLMQNDITVKHAPGNESPFLKSSTIEGTNECAIGLQSSSTDFRPVEAQPERNDEPSQDEGNEIIYQNEELLTGSAEKYGSDNSSHCRKSPAVEGTDDLQPSGTIPRPSKRQYDTDAELLSPKGNGLQEREHLSEDKTDVQRDNNTTKDKRMSNVPGKPSAKTISTDNIELIWDKPGDMTANDTYQVRYKEVPSGKWIFHPEQFTINNGKIGGLKTDTTYVFKVRLVNEDGESGYSVESVDMVTRTSFASKLLESATRVEPQRTSPEIYALPLTENSTARNDFYKTRKYDVGSRPKSAISCKTIILLGATGTGKSTLVDGLANYILGVNFEDPYRFTLASDDERKKQKNQAVSQTDWITCYSFNPQEGSRIKYQLNVIDTPGFGDTRGLERDQEIVEQIRFLFNEPNDGGVQCIDAVCFLVKAPDARLTATQTYVFQSLVSLFGKDIEQNICTLITFADGSDPPVLDAMNESEVPFGNHFTFNNSALFAQNGNSVTSLAPMFWDMGMKSFIAFFEHLQTTETKSLQLTIEVLYERNRLELTIQNLRLQIDRGLSTIQTLKDRKKVFKDNQDIINDNKDFEYEEKELRQQIQELEPGHHVTNCLHCHFTCHDNCVYADDDEKRKCWAMDGNGDCTQCPNRCYWNIHKNTPYIIKYTNVTVKKTYQEMLAKYEEAKGQKLSLEQMLEEIQSELDTLTDIIEELMEVVKDCNNILKKIALMPNPLDMIEQIDLMIQAEKLEMRAGYQQRIDVLLVFRERANIKDSIMKFHTEFSSVHETGAKKKPNVLKRLSNYFRSLVNSK